MDTLIELTNITKEDKKDNELVLLFKGELDETNADKTFEKVYKELNKVKEPKKIIFDFKGLQYLNSKSIWYLADIFSKVVDEDNSTENSLKIINAQESVYDVLELVWLTSIMPIEQAK